MSNPAWTWANLDAEQRKKLASSEEPLGVDYLLAYEATDIAPPDADALAGLQAAPLNESQIECLRGLEDQLHSVVVAYRKRQD